MIQQEVYRSELCENLKSYFKIFDGNKQTMNRFIDDGSNLIREHCSTIKDEIKNSTQTLITKLQECCESYLHRINKYEIETIEKLNLIRQNDLKRVFLKKIIKTS